MAKTFKDRPRDAVLDVVARKANLERAELRRRHNSFEALVMYHNPPEGLVSVSEHNRLMRARRIINDEV